MIVRTFNERSGVEPIEKKIINQAATNKFDVINTAINGVIGLVSLGLITVPMLFLVKSVANDGEPEPKSDK